MIPGFVDTHAHAFPYLKAGTDTVDCRGYPHEDCRERNNKKMSRVVDEQLAKTVYKKMLVRNIEMTITIVQYVKCRESFWLLMYNCLFTCLTFQLKRRKLRFRNIGVIYIYGFNENLHADMFSVVIFNLYHSLI